MIGNNTVLCVKCCFTAQRVFYLIIMRTLLWCTSCAFMLQDEEIVWCVLGRYHSTHPLPRDGKWWIGLGDIGINYAMSWTDDCEWKTHELKNLLLSISYLVDPKPYGPYLNIRIFLSRFLYKFFSQPDPNFTSLYFFPASYRPWKFDPSLRVHVLGLKSSVKATSPSTTIYVLMQLKTQATISQNTHADFILVNYN